jgi:hypothetical protein
MANKYDSTYEPEERALRSGRLPDKETRTRQQRNLERAQKMLEEGPPKGISANEMKQRLGFMADAMRQSRMQRELDTKLADQEARASANEMRRETREVRPTPGKDRADMATHNYYKGFDKPLFGGKEGLPVPGMKKGGKVKKYDKGGVTEKNKPRKATFSAERIHEVEEGAQGKYETPTGISHINRTKGGKSKYMFSMPDDKAGEYASELQRETRGMKKGGKVKSASARADGIAIRGKTRA